MIKCNRRYNCAYKFLCSDENSTGNVICLKLIEDALKDNSWKERAVYKFKPYQGHFDDVKLSLQLKNPILYFGYHDLFGYNIYEKSENQYFYIPITTIKKPLLYDFDITINGSSASEVINRLSNGKIVASLMYHSIPWLRNSLDRIFIGRPVELKEKDSVTFLAALFSSSREKISSTTLSLGNIDTASGEFLNHIIGYIEEGPNSDNLIELKKAIKRAMTIGLKNIDLLAKINRSLKKFKKHIKKCIKNYREENSLEDIKIRIAYKAILRLSYLVKDRKVNNIPNFVLPLKAVRDYLYLSNNNDTYTLSNFIWLCTYYARQIFLKLKNLISAIDLCNIMLKENLDIKEIIEIIGTSELINSIVVLKELMDDFFILFIPISIRETNILVKMKFLEKNELCKKIMSHPLNLRAAQSTHFHLASDDISYNIRLKAPKKGSNEIRLQAKDTKNIFGRLEENRNHLVIHGNTRKKQLIKPFHGNNTSLLDNIDITTSTCQISAKYSCSGSLSFILSALLIISIGSLWFSMFAIVVAIALRVSDISHINNFSEVISWIGEVLKSPILDEEGKEILLYLPFGSNLIYTIFYAFLPIIGIFISLSIFKEWSVIHYLSRWYKRFILIFGFVSCVIIVSVIFGLPIWSAIMVAILLGIIIKVF